MTPEDDEGPPGFTGLDGERPIHRYTRRLPHWRQDGATYWVTFRQDDALDQQTQENLRILRRTWEQLYPPPRTEEQWNAYAHEYTSLAERWLDRGYGSCVFRDRRWADQLSDALRYRQDEWYYLGASVVMPNHVHLLVRPFPGRKLERLLQYWKSHIARKLNHERGTPGQQLWMEESYDRIVRDVAHLDKALQYLGRNPTHAGLEHEKGWRRWIAPEWREADWVFEDENAEM